MGWKIALNEGGVLNKMSGDMRKQGDEDLKSVGGVTSLFSNALAFVGLGPTDPVKEREEKGKESSSFFGKVGDFIATPFNMFTDAAKSVGDTLLGKSSAPASGGKTFAEQVGTMTISAPAREIANKYNKEVLNNTGSAANPLEKFERDMKMLREATAGMMSSTPGGLFSGIGSIMSDKAFKFGVNESYTALSKTVNQTRYSQPSTVYRDTEEAQDAINRAQLGPQRNVQEEILETLKAAKEAQAQQLTYQKQVAEAMVKIAAEGLMEGDGF